MNKKVIITTDVKNCARCGKDHKQLNFQKFTHCPPKYSHYSFCPNNGEPIMMMIINDDKKPSRKLDDKERAKGRSEGYWDMSPENQWAEDKRLGILDWDGN